MSEKVAGDDKVLDGSLILQPVRHLKLVTKDYARNTNTKPYSVSRLHRLSLLLCLGDKLPTSPKASPFFAATVAEKKCKG